MDSPAAWFASGVAPKKKTGISWTDETWNPVRGCSRVSEGCRNCYAETMAARIVRMSKGKPSAYDGLVRMVGGEARWTGEVAFDAETLAAPLSWRKPRRIFVNSMSDLFHEKLTNEQIAAVFGVMAACPQHTFQVLTKRPKRMREWFETPGTADLVDRFRHIAIAGRIEEYFADQKIAPIDGWPGYFITSRGVVLSECKGRRQELKPMKNEQGHERVMLYRDGGEPSRPQIHRLVLSAFDSAQPNSVQACHITGDPSNNALWNLRWGTQSSNWDDRKRHGNRRSYTKLTEDQVAEIRGLGDNGISGAEIGRRFNISDTQARNILTGKQWAPEYRPTWPIPWVWLGVSVENQAAADERIPDLLATPAAVRFLSCEPLLGEVDLVGRLDYCDRLDKHGISRRAGGEHMVCDAMCGISWAIAGCESGPGARPCDVAWLRSLRDQCADASVPFFLKQAVADNSTGSGSSFISRVTDGQGSKRKAGGVIELPYLDGVQHAAFPIARTE